MSPARAPSQRARYNDLFERMLDSAFLVDPASLKVLEANAASERAFLAPAERLQKGSVLDWISPAHAEEFRRSVRVAMRRFHPRQFDCHWVDVDGNPLTMETVMCMLRLDDGRELLQVIAVDVTEDRRHRDRIAEHLNQLEEMNEKLQALSTTDELTQIANYRRFRDELGREHARAARYGTPYAVVFFDADHFKHFNDTNGHPAGDRLLRQLAEILREEARNTDLPARYGGEEFVVLCPGVDAEGASVLAERVRARVASTDFKHGEEQPGGRFTVSVGVASFPAHGASEEQVLQAADQALYVSKKSGRNRCTLAQAQAELGPPRRKTG
ncbi:MAG: diguanylate cyclase [Bdellovibrionales bacterium]|nr:diguanylate cyclase [Bdellovibrionales bacterium]